MENLQELKPFLRLFKSVPISRHSDNLELNQESAKQTIPFGFVISPEVSFEYSITKLSRTVKSIFGMTAEEINSTFHKSWVKVRDASIAQLVIEQITHYFTTYGFEAFGIADPSLVYIPNEELDIPNVNEDFSIMVIRGYTKDKFKEKLLNLASGIALSEESVNDVVDCLIYLNINTEDLHKIKNREVYAMLCDQLSVVPEAPEEFMRHVIYKVTGSALLIKSPETVNTLRSIDNNMIRRSIKKYFILYAKEFGLTALASAFFRMKPLFLALRHGVPELKPTINHIRKLANKYHKPIKEDYFNSVTAGIKSGKLLKFDKSFSKRLQSLSVFRKVRLAYALKFRTTDAESIVYRIRNGKGYAKEFDPSLYPTNVVEECLECVLGSIASDMSKVVKKKKIFIPDGISYTLPATEKQFVGYLPSGTSVAVEENLLIGVHWNDVKSKRAKRVDLDLSLLSNSQKMGWDSYYRDKDRSILFSGDMTGAPEPEGASEFYYVGRFPNEPFVIMLNFYNYGYISNNNDENLKVPFEIIIASNREETLEENYMVDLNKVLLSCKSSIAQRQKILGIVLPSSEGVKVCLMESQLGMAITSSISEVTLHSNNFINHYYANTISLDDMLIRAGAILATDRNECDINLSPESLEKDTIINLIRE